MFGSKLKKLNPLDYSGAAPASPRALPASPRNPPAITHQLPGRGHSPTLVRAVSGTLFDGAATHGGLPQGTGFIPERNGLSRAGKLTPACDTTPQSGTLIVIGRATDGGGAIAPRVLASHLCVTGQPGMGKTTAMVSLISQLVRSGISVVVLEPAKVEYADALHGAGVPTRPFGLDGENGAATLQTNPFLVDEHVLPRVWIQDLCTCIQDAYGLKEQPLPLHLRALVERLYRLRSIDANRFASSNAAFPTVRDFLTQIQPYLQEETCLSAKLTQDLAGALTSRGRALCQNPAFAVKHGIGARDLLDFGARVKVLQLSDLGPSDGAFIGMLLLLRVMRASRRLEQQPLHTVFVIEEAHSLLVDQMSGQPTAFAHLYESALAELRAAGIGFATVDQRPALLPTGVLANSVTKIALASTHGDDRTAIAKAFALSEPQEQRFGSLGVGEALLQTAGMPAKFVQLGS